MSHKIPQVEPLVMEGLNYAEDLYLSSIGLQELELTDLKNRLIKAIRSAVIPLAAYRREFDRYAPLFLLDVDQFVE